MSKSLCNVSEIFRGDKCPECLPPGCVPDIHRINFKMLEVRKNEIALRKLSGGSAQLRTLGEHWLQSLRCEALVSDYC